MKLFFNLQNPNMLSIELRQGERTIDEEALTISQGFDTLLIRAIDNIIVRNTIGRLSLNSTGIKGKIEGQTIWGMILKTVKVAIEV